VLLEPQSTALFLLLMVAFCALLAFVAIAKQPAVRVLAASLAFVPAMLFGVAAVNKYYDYYQTWGSVAADLSAQGTSNVSQVPTGASGQQLAKILGKVSGSKTAAKDGETVQLTVTGRLSHITRTVLIYLPPQYFQRAYAHRRFPAIELITGFPGQPQDWINVVGITQTYLTLLHDGVVKPAVLVMPNANGGPQVSLQCLNVRRGPQDATFLAEDVPSVMSHSLRVVAPGQAWGIAGYSEGGYCAANLALVYPERYGFSGVLSGYFAPLADQLGNPLRVINPFGNDKKARDRNTPLLRLRALPLYVHIPQFWLGAGSAWHTDVNAAQGFQRLLLARQPGVTLDIEPGGSHNMATWRALVPPLLEWMTPRLAYAQLHPPCLERPRALPSPSPGSAVTPVPAPRPTPLCYPHSRPRASASPSPSGPTPAPTPSLTRHRHTRSGRTGVARRHR
jgi:enterochelin esterase-like enzyme